MSGSKIPDRGLGFSVEMKQRKHVKTIMVSDGDLENVLFEGNLGRLVELSMADHSVLEIRGLNGILRVDLTIDELDKMVSRIRSEALRIVNSEMI